MSEMSRPTQSPHSGHKARLRKRFQKAPATFQDYEILELLLGYVLIRKDTKPLAKELLARFENIRGVLNARQDELVTVPGFGEGLAIYWDLIRELMSRYAEAPMRQRCTLVTPEDVATMAQVRLAGFSHEECWIALLDNQNRLLHWERLFRGTHDTINIQPRDVFELALLRKATGIILVHNHPGGNATPSTPDMLLTQELKRLCPYMGLRFLDHIIVTEENCYSFTNMGLL